MFMSKLPKVFANQINTNLNNNVELFDSRSSKDYEGVDVSREVNKIFHSNNFVYKSNVLIVLKDKRVIETSLVGRDNLFLFTLDGQKILISDILNIKKRD